MTYQNTKTTTFSHSLADVINWAEAEGRAKAPIYEALKIPARMGMIDEDIGLIAGDLEYFEKKIADLPIASVSKSKDLDRTRRTSNSRIRSLLRAYEQAHGAAAVDAGSSHRASYTALINWVKDREGFIAKGDLFTTSTHKSLFALRARADISLEQLEQSHIDRIFAVATVEKRRSMAKAIRLLTQLRGLENQRPELCTMLPRTNLTVPKTSDRAERIRWDAFPEGFRKNVASIIAETLATPADLAAWAKREMEAGRSSQEIDQEICAKTAQRGSAPKNPESAKAGYQQAITWLARPQRNACGTFAHLTTLKGLITRDAIEQAIMDQIDRAQRSLLLKDPAKSTTLGSRLTNLTTLAKHGLRDPEVVSHINILRFAHHEFVVTQKEMTDDADHTCRMLRDRPHLAAAFVHAPTTISVKALQTLERAVGRHDNAAEDRALRMFASAVAHGLQLSRPLRTSNLIALRHKGTRERGGNITWIKKRTHAELRFEKGEIKNDQVITVHVMGHDAALLWDWIEIYRPRFLALRDLPDSAYVFPGLAQPRLPKRGVTLPVGAMAASSFAELWALGHAAVNLGIQPHSCRHAVATLILAVEPGNFAKAAAVLGDKESTVRRHYGKDSGEAAAMNVRAALLAHHPEVFNIMKGKRP
ncbi:integrase [Loktanella ponticola]|uniref:Integrase n=1 Tax=Yoonia ponticola TaxID=1524255 RepID=A0A7W9EZC5_9RHOB|nr:site-specific integrase [Yoonia ponticola]MBB5723667.1 integrase [Yoonia ponticola]